MLLEGQPDSCSNPLHWKSIGSEQFTAYTRVRNESQIHEKVVINPLLSLPSEIIHVPSTHPQYEPFLPNNSPCSIAWKDLVVTSKLSKTKNSLQLLKNVSGEIGGGMWAVMGPSGSGKTTLLSVLAHRLESHRFSIEGTITINSEVVTRRLIKQVVGYVMQDDLIHSHLTVDETLEYTGLLRLPRIMTPEDRLTRKMKVVRLMQLSHAYHTIVGDSRNKGLSGGERKRLCVGMELLLKPKLLFLDEPTSGGCATCSCSQSLTSLIFYLSFDRWYNTLSSTLTFNDN